MMRTAVLTGANGQLGRAFTAYLLSKGYEVYALDLRFTEDFPPAAHKTIIDITNEKDVLNFFASLERIDVLINNAGIGVFTPFEERTVEEFMSVVDVNLKGTFLMCREAVKKMRPIRAGKIVNIGSMYGVVSSDVRIYGISKRNNSEVYSMTKAGVIMFTRYLAAHYAAHNIQVNCLSPGGVYNRQTEDFVGNYTYRNPSGRMGAPKDLLPALEFLISETNTYTTGQNVVVDGGHTAW